MKTIFKIKLIVFIFLTLFSCKEEVKVTDNNELNDNEIYISEEQFVSSEMAMSTLTKQTFSNVIKASGIVDVAPQYKAKVTPIISGYVKQTFVQNGSKVSKGQVIAIIESTELLDIQKEYAEIAHQLNYLKSEFLRQKTLYDEKITSQKNYLKAQSDYHTAQSLYNGLKQKLRVLNCNTTSIENGKFNSNFQVVAPISGDVSHFNANVGMHLSTLDYIAEIIDSNHLQINLSVFEKDILKIKPKQVISFKTPDAGASAFTSYVNLVGKSLDTNNRTLSVTGSISKDLQNKLVYGMYVDANIVIDSYESLAIENEAIFTENNNNLLLILEPNKKKYTFKKALVKTLNKSENFTEIITDENINLNTKILTKGVFDVTN